MNSEADYRVVAVEEDDGYAFRLCPKARVLRSAELVNGVPVLHFEEPLTTAVQGLSEEDLAVTCRLASEGARPEFVFIAFPPNHLFYGRQYMKCEPEWIEGTSVYKTLFGADWAMKGLHIGMRSNEERTRFWDWGETTCLEGRLATRLDFPQSKSSGSVMMSCEHVKLRRRETKLEFVGEPKLHINDETSPLYTRCINRVLPSLTHYDEPLFRQMQETIKSQLVAEWFVQTGVRISVRWITEHTAKTTVYAPAAVGRKSQLPSSSDGRMVNQSAGSLGQTGTRAGTIEPTKNVGMKRSEAKRCKKSAKGGISKPRFGWYDHGSMEMVVFEADGTPCTKMNSMKTFCERRVIVNGELKEATQMQINFPFIEELTNDPTSESNKAKLSQLLQQSFEFTGILGTVSTQLEIKKENGDTTILMSAESNPLIVPHLKVTGCMRISASNYDMLYQGMDPNTPICKDVIPKVQSWNHLFSKTVPWPRVWHLPYEGGGVPTSSGGVTMRNIPVIEERAVMREPAAARPLVPIPQPSMSNQGSYLRQMVLMEEKYNLVVQKFRSMWSAAKGVCPPVNHIFEVNNPTLLSKWSAYRATLSDRMYRMVVSVVQSERLDQVEEHFHGTSLACNLATSKKLCPNPKCGICGISCRGLDPNYIGTKIGFQRFGSGFYLAPNSSKCHDYTEGSHGFRALLMCDVCPGKKHHLQRTNEALSRPPRGCDSIVGTVGTELNFTEIVLYRPEAVMPRYIILYTKDGTAHLLRS